MMFISCSSTLLKKTERNRYLIINKEINALVGNSKEEASVLLEKHLQQYFTDDLEALTYREDSYKYHLLTTIHSLSKTDFKLIFNESQINLYKQQLKQNEVVNTGKIDHKKVNLIDLKHPQNILSFYYNKILIMLSNPVFTKNNEYAIIGCYLGTYYRDSGDSWFSIYKKKEGKWVLFKRISLGVI